MCRPISSRQALVEPQPNLRGLWELMLPQVEEHEAKKLIFLKKTLLLWICSSAMTMEVDISSYIT